MLSNCFGATNWQQFIVRLVRAIRMFCYFRVHELRTVFINESENYFWWFFVSWQWQLFVSMVIADNKTWIISHKFVAVKHLWETFYYTMSLTFDVRTVCANFCLVARFTAKWNDFPSSLDRRLQNFRFLHLPAINRTGTATAQSHRVLANIV